MKVIINADDRGFSSKVDEHIENAIQMNVITSTTIMANMEDFNYAIQMYNMYKSDISFGFHMNLSEGAPLLYSQLLLDKGFYKEANKTLVFNGKEFWYKVLNRECREAIIKELIEQANKLRDCHVNISHLDSHHHIHTSLFMLSILPIICKKLNINKVRNIRNYMPLSVNKVIRNGWTYWHKKQNKKMLFTDYFCSFRDYMSKPYILKSNETIELMCHPGHLSYSEEENLLFSKEFINLDYIELTNYNKIYD